MRSNRSIPWRGRGESVSKPTSSVKVSQYVGQGASCSGYKNHRWGSRGFQRLRSGAFNLNVLPEASLPTAGPVGGHPIARVG